MTTLIDQFLSVVDAFRFAKGDGVKPMSDARASTLIFNDGKRIGFLRSGRDQGTRSHEQALLWLSTNWPDGAVWPPGVKRPSREKVAA